MMDKYSKQRINIIHSEIADIDKDLKQILKDKAKLQLNYEKFQKELKSGISFNKDGDSIEELT